MTRNADDAARAFRSANPVPAGAFDDAAQGAQAMQTLQRILAVQPEQKGRRLWRRPAILALLLAAIIGAAAGVAMLVTGAGPQTARIATAAYTVTSNGSGGTVYLVISKALTDPSGLSRALASEGVPNRVLVGRPSCPPGSGWSGKPLPAARNVISAGPNADSSVLHPHQMPAGSVIVVTVVRVPGSSIYAVGVSLADHPPTCVTYTGPASGRSTG